jgi:hypothetical protein
MKVYSCLDPKPDPHKYYGAGAGQNNYGSRSRRTKNIRIRKTAIHNSNLKEIIIFFTPLVTSRNDDWNSERPKEEARAYDGPAGMEPEGLIESNWDEVRMLFNIYSFGEVL